MWLMRSMRFGEDMAENERFVPDEQGFVYDIETMGYVSDIFKLLNELHTENENITLLAQHNYEESKRIINRYVDKIKELERENRELKLQLEAFKDKLCELGVSDVKLYGKRYYTGLEEWLND